MGVRFFSALFVFLASSCGLLPPSRPPAPGRAPNAHLKRQVTVKYDVAGAPEGAEPRSMRKFYRFSVMNPVTVSSTCAAVRGSSPFVELQLVNTTQVIVVV